MKKIAERLIQLNDLIDSKVKELSFKDLSAEEKIHLLKTSEDLKGMTADLVAKAEELKAKLENEK